MLLSDYGDDWFNDNLINFISCIFFFFCNILIEVKNVDVYNIILEEFLFIFFD